MTKNTDTKPRVLQLEGLEISREEILEDFRIATLSRELDRVEKAWQKAGRAKFCILGSGQEIAQLAAVRPMLKGGWLRSYYRGITEALTADILSPREVLAQVLGDSEDGHDPSSGGRMMGRHFGSALVDKQGQLKDLTKQINHASDVSPTASQMGPALGLALASKVFHAHRALCEAHPRLSNHGREVVHVSIGDSSLAEGIALEAINQAVVQKAPLLISVYDNGYGISVPLEKQFTHASVSKALSGFAPDESGRGMLILGPLHDWDYCQLRAQYQKAYDWIRETRQPALVHVLVTQLEGHSSSGDHRRYKSQERLDWELEHDGLRCLRQWILDEQWAEEDELLSIEQRCQELVNREAEGAWLDYYQPLIDLAQTALSQYQSALDKDSSLSSKHGLAALAKGLVSDLDPKTQNHLSRSRLLIFARTVLRAARGQPQLSAEVAALQAYCRDIESEAKRRFSTDIFATGEHSPINAPRVEPRYAESAAQDSGAHIIAAGFATMMKDDARIVVFGEDVGALGGVTTCTLGLQSGEAQVEAAIWKKSPALQKYTPKEGFGEARVWDTAIAEGTIVGAAAGMALRGLRPVGEIQYHDYVNYGAQQLEDEVACLRHRSRGGQEVPCLIRCHGHRLLGMWHSGSPMAMMLRMPGLRVITPRNAVQAVALYRAALKHGRDPVFSVEPLLDLYSRMPVPDNIEELCLPFGQTESLRAGADVSIVTYGHCCAIALKAAEQLAEDHGIEAEVLDLQTLNPLDLNDLAGASIRRTGRVLFLDEDYAQGAMSMISKTLLFERTDEQGRPTMWYLDGVKLLTAPEHKPAYGGDGGYFSKPQIESVVDSICELFDELDGGSRRLY